MARFRKKPVVVEATQWFPGVHVDGVQEMAYDPGDGTTKSYEYGMINTLEGPHKVTPGDWVITGVEGEKYACKPRIFEKTYEPVNDTECSVLS